MIVFLAIGRGGYQYRSISVYMKPIPIISKKPILSVSVGNIENRIRALKILDLIYRRSI